MKKVSMAELLTDKKMLGEFCVSMQNGAVAILPTDTLYGFAVAANRQAAVSRIYQIKNRSAHKPLILFIHEIAELKKIGFEILPGVYDVLLEHWPGALTAILKKPDHESLSCFDFPTLGVRIPAHAQLLQLLAALPVKLLTTSANRSGDPSDIDPENIAREFLHEIDWFVDGGLLAGALPSTVADFTVRPPKVLRQGGLIL